MRHTWFYKNTLITISKVNGNGTVQVNEDLDRGTSVHMQYRVTKEEGVSYIYRDRQTGIGECGREVAINLLYRRIKPCG